MDGKEIAFAKFHHPYVNSWQITVPFFISLPDAYKEKLDDIFYP